MSSLPTLTRPGVYVVESPYPTYVSAAPGQAVAAFVGAAPRGPLTPTIVHSWKEFTANYGDFTAAQFNYTDSPPNAFVASALHLAVYSYFSAGGSGALIIRATRPYSDPAGPVVASYTFDDADSQATLQINASNPGYWGNNLFIDILPGNVPKPPPNNNTFTIQVKNQGSGQINVVEVWPNVTMSQGSTNQGVGNYAPDIINNPYTGSKYINVLDLQLNSSTPTAPPGNNPVPTTASQPLAGGSDGASLAYQNISDAALAGLDQFPEQPFVLNAPGLSDSTTIGALTGYAENRGDIFVVIDPPVGNPPDAMADYVNSLASSSKAAVYYPQVYIADPFSPVQGRTRLIPPGGFVVGRYISTDASRGMAKAPAGLGASLLGAYGLERVLSNTDQGVLTQANVNCIVSIPNAGIVIWGARTLSPYLITRYVPVVRTLIYLKTEFVSMTKFAVFEPNDYVLWNQITAVLTQFLMSFWQTGGLNGLTYDQAFYVTCDDSNNTPASIQQGIVNVEVGVALQDPAEFIIITIGQWAGGSNATVVGG